MGTFGKRDGRATLLLKRAEVASSAAAQQTTLSSLMADKRPIAAVQALDHTVLQDSHCRMSHSEVLDSGKNWKNRRTRRAPVKRRARGHISAGERKEGKEAPDIGRSDCLLALPIRKC